MQNQVHKNIFSFNQTSPGVDSSSQILHQHYKNLSIFDSYLGPNPTACNAFNNSAEISLEEHRLMIDRAIDKLKGELIVKDKV